VGDLNWWLIIVVSSLVTEDKTEHLRKHTTPSLPCRPSNPRYPLEKAKPLLPSVFCEMSSSSSSSSIARGFVQRVAASLTSGHKDSNPESFRNKHPFEKRKAEADRIRLKYPDRIPVISEKAEKSEIPDIDKVSRHMPAFCRRLSLLYVRHLFLVYSSSFVPCCSF
jgi:hypothetical protein